jgi:integrase
VMTLRLGYSFGALDTAHRVRVLHIVPLSRQAVAILRELHASTGDVNYLSIRTKVARPMSDNTPNAALRGLGYTTGEMTALLGARCCWRAYWATVART